jgi:putative acetyltransferase
MNAAGAEPLAYELELQARPNEDVAVLVEELECELSQHYPDAQQRHGYSLEQIFQPEMRFFLVRSGPDIAGCGGVALLEGFAELKRMYIRPAFRGSGAADALLRRLEVEAVSSGRTRLLLETGSKLLAAQRFYARHGFRFRPTFEPYSSMPPHAVAGSVFMEKRLG